MVVLAMLMLCRGLQCAFHIMICQMCLPISLAEGYVPTTNSHVVLPQKGLLQG